MEESDGLAFGTDTRLFIDQPDTRGAAALERCRKVVDRKTEVVDPRATFGDEFADG